jgi:CRISPR-associated endonuclease/helicase Cas3
MGDRLAIEERVMASLGKLSNPEMRRGVVLVGSQVLEQSLDYDVDCMFTDLAPIDLIVQRAGRLWRHTDRDKRRPVQTRELVVVSPDPSHGVDRDWYRQVSRRAAAVYRHHGIVWRSARTLFETGAIETPGGIRGLIEAVYGPEACDVPEALQRDSNAAEGKSAAGRSIAGANLLRVEKGYGGESAVWQSETGTPTRLAEPVTVFRLGEVIDGTIVPMCRADDGDLRRSWALSEVSIAERRAAGVPDPSRDLAPLVATAKASWPEWEREQQPLLVLVRDGDRWTGATRRTDGQVTPVLYDRHLGFRQPA